MNLLGKSLPSSEYANKTKDFFKNTFNKVNGNNSPFGIFLKFIIAIFLIIFLIGVIKKILNGYNDYKGSSPWILKGTKDAKKRMIILQDPSKESATTINRSKNEEKGLEFSYTFWMYINDWSYRHGQWKHVMHKGNDKAWPLRAPGIWIHPKENTLRVYMNTFNKIDEFIDIPNIPLNKWVNISVCVRQRNMDIYINGSLALNKLLTTLPRQNYGDLYINSFGGFGGYLSNIRYYDYYIPYSEMKTHLTRGVSLMPCVDSDESPPYLAPGWWTNK